MEKIKNFKLTLDRHFGKIIIYELELDFRKEKIIEILGEEIRKTERKLDNSDFEQKIYEIKENVSKLKNEYINNNNIDGIEIRIDIIYTNNVQKNILCKNVIPKEVEDIIKVTNI